MTRYLAVTTCNADQWERFGWRMVDTFGKFWESGSVFFEGVFLPTIVLRVYSDGWGNDGLDEAAPWLAEFKRRYAAPQYNGGPGGRDYRHDAVRFAHKIAALGAAAETADCDVLIWIDADVITHAPVTEEWLDSLFPESAVIAWLDRDRTYPECGFLMFRMPEARQLIGQIVKAYRKGAIFGLPEWHDSYVIQHYVRALKVPAHSLSGPEGRKYMGHPWLLSPLAEKMDHLKGEHRKQAGRSSLGSTMRQLRREPYWQ